MQLIFTFCLVIHILGGATGLISGTINLFRKKGDRLHRKLGTFFYFGMLCSSGSAIVLSILHPNYFLASVGIFTAYMSLSGKRYLHFQNADHKARQLDWILTYSMLLTALVFVATGTLHLIQGRVFGLVFGLFGYLAFRFYRSDLSNYKGHSPYENFWLTSHVQRMIGAYIASLTAFLVVNNSYLPSFVPGILWWILPSLLLVPFIVKWTRMYQIEKKGPTHTVS